MSGQRHALTTLSTG